MDDFIGCIGMDGKTVPVPREKVSYRPSVYGVIISNGKLLLTKTRSTGKYWLPGGGIDIGETIEEALKREVHEECGIEIEVQSPLFFRERFFYYEPWQSAWQCYLFFYEATTKSFELTLNDQHDESIDPQWVEIQSLKSTDFQIFGDDVIEYLRLTAEGRDLHAELNKE